MFCYLKIEKFALIYPIYSRTLQCEYQQEQNLFETA